MDDEAVRGMLANEADTGGIAAGATSCSISFCDMERVGRVMEIG
jgi:hypothetical protein